MGLQPAGGWIAPDADGVPGALHVRRDAGGMYQGRCLNVAALRMVGLAPEQTAFELSQALGPTHALGELIDDALGAGEIRATELAWSGVGGVDRVRCVITPADEGALVLLEDVTDRHRANDALEAAERRLAQVQDWRGGGFWELDMRTGQVYWSTQAFEILPLDDATLSGFLDRVHPDDRALIEHVADRALAQPGPYRATHRTQRGTEIRVVQHSMQSVVGDDGLPHRLLGFVTDVTAEHALEEQMRLASAHQSIALLAGGLVHDLNNAFAIVHGHAQMGLQAHQRGEPVDPVHLEAIGRAATSAQELTRSLLSVGRDDALAPTRFAPDALLDRVATMARATLGAARSVLLRLDDTELDVVADPGRVERVLIDLVVNARDALPADGGTVAIGFERAVLDHRHELVVEGVLAAGTYGAFVVEDDGSGIDEDTLDRITEPFFSTKPSARGSGIGLASANAFAHRSGGHLSVASEAGSGTTVTVLLPAIDRSSADGGNRPSARRVLVVAADAAQRARLGEIVEDAGFQVVRATTLPKAATVLRTEPIDLVVADEVVAGPLAASSAWRGRRGGPVSPLLVVVPEGGDRQPVPGATVLPVSARDDEISAAVRELLGAA